MRIAIVTGIYPPDIGGPATHASDLRGELVRRGHEVVVVTISDRHDPEVRDRPEVLDPVVRFPRRWSWQRRLAAVTRWLLDNRRRYDIVYALGLHPAAVAGARLAARPVVVRVAGDAAWERAERLGLTWADFQRFQGERSTDFRILGMRWIRDWSLRRATAITVPSRFMAQTVRRWLGGPADVEIVPSAVRIPEAPPRRVGDRSEMLEALFVGRLIPLKRVDTLLEAVAKTPGVTFEVIGDGPERASLEARSSDLGVGDRVRFTGVLPHDDVLARMASADVLVLASTVENFSHVVIEALASGTPVVAPGIGGIPEAVVDEATGVLLESPSVENLAEALARVRDDRDLLSNMSDRASREAARWSLPQIVDRLEDLLRRSLERRPKAVFLGKGQPNGFQGRGLESKFAMYGRHLAPTIVTSGRMGIRHHGGTRIVLLPQLRPAFLGGVFFYAVGPAVAQALAAGRRRCAIVCQSPYDAFGVLLLSRILPPALRPGVVVEVHGDWRAASRHLGNRGRRIVSPVADRVAEWAIRRADRVRTVSASLEQLVRDAGYGGDVDQFPTFTDLTPFLEAPPASFFETPTVLFVGVLERTKGVDVLLSAWAGVAGAVPEARLEIAGDGPEMQTLRRRAGEPAVPGAVRFFGSVPKGLVPGLLDRCWISVLPSRSEGLPRVVLESFARGRPVIASDVGGIGELVKDGSTGLLVPPEDPGALADAILALLKDGDRAREMGAAARRFLEDLDPGALYEDGVERLARWIDQRSSSARAPAGRP